MAELNVITWMWGIKYGDRDVIRLQRQLQKRLRIPHTFTVFTDRDCPGLAPSINVRRIKDPELCARNCFCRLRMFDPEWQKENGFTDYIVSLDLDLVLTDRIDDAFIPTADFKILQGVNAVNPCPFNGSVMMLKAGAHPEVWHDFSVEKAHEMPHHEFPDDQGWIYHKLPDAAGWKPGPESGIYAFQKPGWPMGEFGYELPKGARIVAFVGKRKPGMYTRLPWVKKYWLFYDKP